MRFRSRTAVRHHRRTRRRTIGGHDPVGQRRGRGAPCRPLARRVPCTLPATLEPTRATTTGSSSNARTPRPAVTLTQMIDRSNAMPASWSRSCRRRTTATPRMRSVARRRPRRCSQSQTAAMRRQRGRHGLRSRTHAVTFSLRLPGRAPRTSGDRETRVALRRTCSSMCCFRLCAAGDRDHAIHRPPERGAAHKRPPSRRRRQARSTEIPALPKPEPSRAFQAAFASLSS